MQSQTQFFAILSCNLLYFISECIVSRLDLWFLIDGSGSIGAVNFQACLSFVNQTASTFFIEPNRVRTGLMIYSSSNTTRSYFNQHQSNEEFSKVVLSTRYPAGGMIYSMLSLFLQQLVQLCLPSQHKTHTCLLQK